MRAGASAYIPKGRQDTYETDEDGRRKREGGIDDLVNTCRRLLEVPERDDRVAPPDTIWLRENYDWLRDEFGGRWIAFIDRSLAISADIRGKERGGHIVVGELSKEELSRFLIGKLPYLPHVPPIAWLPNE
jgi:hypothetical protein